MSLNMWNWCKTCTQLEKLIKNHVIYGNLIPDTGKKDIETESVGNMSGSLYRLHRHFTLFKDDLIWLEIYLSCEDFRGFMCNCSCKLCNLYSITWCPLSTVCPLVFSGVISFFLLNRERLLVFFSVDRTKGWWENKDYFCADTWD